MPSSNALQPTQPNVAFKWLVAIWRAAPLGFGLSAALGRAAEPRAAIPPERRLDSASTR